MFLRVASERCVCLDMHSSPIAANLLFNCRSCSRSSAFRLAKGSTPTAKSAFKLALRLRACASVIIRIKAQCNSGLFFIYWPNIQIQTTTISQLIGPSLFNLIVCEQFDRYCDNEGILFECIGRYLLEYRYYGRAQVADTIINR